MTDPFFTTGKNQNSNQGTSQGENSQQTIDNLKSQQLQIQEKYKQLKYLLQNEALTLNQQNEVQEQMQKLSNLYSQNKATLASLTTSISGEKEIHINKNINTENSKAKAFSFKKFMIGCGILGMIFLGGLVVVFSSLMKEPGRLVSFGISGCTAVSLLQIFSIVFFGLLFFLGLALLLININKTIVTKNKSKFSYFVGIIFSLALLITVGFLLVNMLQRLSQYANECTDWGDTQLAHPHVVVKDSKFKDMRLPSSEYNKMIAPINIEFDLNQTEYKNTIIKLSASKINSVTLACGNGQELPLGEKGDMFAGRCFYTEAKSYQPELVINYTDASLSPKEQRYPIGQDISITSELKISSEKTSISALNSSLLVGKNPVNLKFDAASVFRDFNLPYDIMWSAECNGIWDNNSSVEFQHIYQNEGVYEVCVAFPALSSEYIYTFPIRVEQGEVQDNFSVSYTVSTSTSSVTYDNPDSIEITKIPTTVTVEVVSVTPDNPSIQRKLYKDGIQVPSEFSNTNIFKLIIDEDREYDLTLEIANAERQVSTKKGIKVSVNKKDYDGVLKVSPSNVGTSPFEVKLDASTTSLKDPSDEIVFFTRDFGDGVINKNISEAVVSHEYVYDFEKENGVFYPAVTLQTKKGLLFTITGVIINIKKPDTTLEIFLDENPAQIASVLQNVPMSITVDGLPKKVYRDFGDGETLECDGRLCSETSHIYPLAGTYTIKVKVEFADKPSLDGKINLVVK